MEVKKCIACLKEKEVKWFYKNSSTKDGWQYRCKLCMKNGILKPKPEKPALLGPSDRLMLNLAFITKEDYINTFKALEMIGYDLKSELSIHQQFCEKYGLPPSKRKPVGKTIWTKEELIDFL